ncbi:MAG: GNAT family N-acetyltransferase [Phycisphaerales bacterium]|nr:GNAT family N-acetyltransferase [Phycisphaerales bacterium]
MTAARFMLVRPEGNETLALRGLRVLVGGPERMPGGKRAAEVEERLKGFLTYARSVGLNIHRQVLAMEGNVVAGMCLWVPAAGRTAMLFGTSLSEFPESVVATRLAIQAAIEDARQAGVVLAQAMLEPADAVGQNVYAEAGMSQLATLTYMERQPPVQPPMFEGLPGITLIPYSESRHADFHRAIVESYRDTLDCPALSGMRNVDDVIAGHKAVGPFDPELWSVLLLDGVAVGCLLLSEIPARRALELVYLGLSPPVRGRGLGRMLMRRVLSIASQRHFDVATLAVDAANTPAVKLYRRCGYVSTTQRVAMVKQLTY